MTAHKICARTMFDNRIYSAESHAILSRATVRLGCSCFRLCNRLFTCTALSGVSSACAIISTLGDSIRWTTPPRGRCPIVWTVAAWTARSLRCSNFVTLIVVLMSRGEWTG